MKTLNKHAVKNNKNIKVKHTKSVTPSTHTKKKNTKKN